MLAYLKAENAYFDGWKAPHQALLDQLFEEMKGRIKEDDSSVPIRDGDLLYWWAFKPGAQYRTWYRKPVGGGDDQIIFDEPAEAEGKEYFRLGALEVSPDGKLARDAGRRQWVGAVPAPHPRPCDRQGHRDGHRGRHRPAGVDQRQRTASSSPRSTTIGAAIAPAITGSARRPTGRSRSTRRPRSSASRVGVGKSHDQQPDLHRDRRQCDERSALRLRRRSDAAADADLARARPTANIRSTRRTGNCGSSPTTTM